MRKHLLLLLLFSGFLNIYAQKCLVNLVSTTPHGVTDTLENAPILVNSDHNVVVSSNQKITPTQYDAMTALQLSNGFVSWTDIYNSSNDKYFTINSYIDAADNIYVTGAVRLLNNNTGFDVFLIKYDKGGNQQWINYFDGANSTTDFGVGIAVDDNTGDVYVAGMTDGTNAGVGDYVVLKYSVNGTYQWRAFYDGGGLDVAWGTSLVKDRLYVTGSSAVSFTNWDVTTVTFDANTGSQLDTNIQANGASTDMVYGMTTDSLGNVYTTGRTADDIQVLKLDTMLNTVWVQSFDGHGFDDAGLSIAVDDSLNVLVTGFSYLNNTDRELVVLKYGSNGNLRWKKQMKGFLGSTTSEGLKIIPKTENEIFVGGNIVFNNNNQDIVFFRLNRNGKLTMDKTYNGTTNNKDKFIDMAVDSNFIHISARTYSTSTLDQNLTLSYQYKDVVHTSATGTDFKHITDEVIINFNANSVKMTAINNKDLVFGSLNQFVQDSVCNKIDTKVGSGFDCNRYPTRKIFLRMTEADSLSYTRMGDYIKVPKFYTRLVVTIPSTITAQRVRDSIRKMVPVVMGADLNMVMTPTSGDSLYYKQGSLHPITSYSNAHINADSCWNITSGTPNVRVGIYDTGIDFNHLDFAGLNNGVILGHNYCYNTAPSGDDGDHGSRVAGIIGARRNNTIGIKGIASGNTDSTGKIGVSIYDMDVMTNGSLAGLQVTGTSNDVLDAIYEGAHSGYMRLNIMNHSYSMGSGYTAQKLFIYQDMIEFCSRNGVAFIGTKGNFNISSNGVSTIPGDWNPEVVSSVGSSGTDGNHCLNPTNCDNGSCWGRSIDFLAPGSASVVMSHTVLQFGQQEAYGWFSGTSAAAPHVAGTMALMMSYYNHPTPHWDNLVHEDCEEILKRTCTDLTSTTYTQAVGYDSVSGYGRINAYQALKKLNKNYYKIRHIDNSHYSTAYSVNSNTIISNKKINWGPQYGSYPSGYRTTSVEEMTTTITYALPPSEKVIGAWPLYGKSCGFNGDTSRLMVDKPYYAEVISATSTTAKLRTWIYRDSATNVTYPPCIPYRSNLSLYTYDSTGTIGIKEKVIEQKDFVLYPNPNQGNFKIAFTTELYKLLSYKIFDILGREIKSEQFKSTFGRNEILIDVKGSYGLYFVKVFDGNQVIYCDKFIKNDN